MVPKEPRRFTRGRLSRGAGLRETTGCLTCRRRHIKCDEGRPYCGACVRKKAPCEYASPEKTRGRARRPVRADEGNHSDPGPSTNCAHDAGIDDVGSSISGDPTSPAAPDQQRAQISLETTQQPDTHLSPLTDMGSTGWREHALDDGLQAGEAISGHDTASQTNYCIVEPPRAHLDSRYSRGIGSLPQLPSFPFGEPSPTLYPAHPAYGGTPDSGTGNGDDSPTSKWLDLLIGDATLQYNAPSEFQYDLNGIDIFGNSVLDTQVASDEASMTAAGGRREDVPCQLTGKSMAATRNVYLRERTSHTRDQQHEKREWEAVEPMELQLQEQILFRHFVEHISQWMDLFDPQRPFGALVPHLALHNVGLMNAILALSARHLGTVNADTPSSASGFRPDPEDTIRYYYRTLHYSQKAMQYDSYKTSLELLASSIIISSYEMLDGSSTDWEKHLKGVFWIQRSQVIHGDSGGLRQAVWWAWICQDAWAAFREKRRPFTFWKPSRSLADMNPSELAARAVYNFAQVVGFCAEEEASENSKLAEVRASEANLLLHRLEEWKSYLTVEFDPIPAIASPGCGNEPFPPMWIQPAAFAVSMQIYYCSLILVHLHRPCAGGFNEYMSRQRSLKKWASAVCGIANTSTSYASSIMSSQCIFIAGMIVENESQRASVLGLLERCSQQAGWPGYQLGHELKRIWQND